MFQKQPIPAVGFSLGLERVLLVMEERGMFPPLGIGPQVLLCRMADVPAAAAIRVATQLRAQGLRVELFADDKAMGKQLGYADTIGAPFAAILGSTELAAGTVALKDLKAGTQVAVPVGDVGVFVSKRS
jgi:histidyl-tRNA synthetase